MKVFSTRQVRELDAYTIEHEPILSVDLMERAALSMYAWFAKNISVLKKIVVFCGTGNNGGDGLALSRMLFLAGFNVEIYYVDAKTTSPDFQLNLSRLDLLGISVSVIRSEEDFPTLSENEVVVDAIFGSGLTRPAEGIYANLIQLINKSRAYVIAIDIPSGLFGDVNPYPNSNTIVKADICLTLQFPKLSFFFAENYDYVKKWIVVPIGIHSQVIDQAETPYNYFIKGDAKLLIHERPTFSHKGTYGHCLVIAGSYGMIGAAVLCSLSAIMSGAGLVTLHVPRCGYAIIQQSVPECLVSIDKSEDRFTQISDISKYTAVSIGPGVGTHPDTVEALKNILDTIKVPLLIDADALNIISQNIDLLAKLPENSVITPHPGEFDRLFGKSTCGFDRLSKAVEMAKKYGIIIVLKGAYTQVILPDGHVSFNSTGNPGMATGGSGDVLSGLISGLMAQGYDSISASLLGVYLHGLAGDLAANARSQYSLKAEDIANSIGTAFNLIEMSTNE